MVMRCREVLSECLLREIGIRIALGAQKGELCWVFVRSALALTGVGVVIGLVVAAAVARMLRTLLFGVNLYSATQKRSSFQRVERLILRAKGRYHRFRHGLVDLDRFVRHEHVI